MMGAWLALHYQAERMLWRELPRYPAHLHIDLLPGFQGSGYGRQLIGTFCAAVAEAGAVGRRGHLPGPRTSLRSQ
jgi:GNAT superfamily N-acetyltransferase